MFHLTTYCIYTVFSNLAYALLGRCIAQRTHPTMSYEKYVEKQILQPLELTNTGFDYTGELVIILMCIKCVQCVYCMYNMFRLNIYNLLSKH